MCHLPFISWNEMHFACNTDAWNCSRRRVHKKQSIAIRCKSDSIASAFPLPSYHQQQASPLLPEKSCLPNILARGGPSFNLPRNTTHFTFTCFSCYFTCYYYLTTKSYVHIICHICILSVYYFIKGLFYDWIKKIVALNTHAFFRCCSSYMTIYDIMIHT